MVKVWEGNTGTAISAEQPPSYFGPNNRFDLGILNFVTTEK